MRGHMTVAVLFFILTGVAGCNTMNDGAKQPSVQTTNGGNGGMGGAGGGY